MAYRLHASLYNSIRILIFPAQWLYGLCRALLGEPGSFATIAREKPASHELGASVGRQDHAISPYASATLVSRSIYVHRIPPRVRDVRNAPLVG
jgi:hypothetical protein